jgi:hypothetical protein
MKYFLLLTILFTSLCFSQEETFETGDTESDLIIALNDLKVKTIIFKTKINTTTIPFGKVLKFLNDSSLEFKKVDNRLIVFNNGFLDIG